MHYSQRWGKQKAGKRTKIGEFINFAEIGGYAKCIIGLEEMDAPEVELHVCPAGGICHDQISCIWNQLRPTHSLILL